MILRAAPASLLMLLASGCFAYRGPSGVEAALHRSLGADLHREVGMKLGPISTKFVATFAGDNDVFKLDGVTSIGFAVYEIGGSGRRTPIDPAELGSGWTTMVDVRDDGDQVIVLAKPRNGSIREMMLLAIDRDEAVVARLTGRLDRFIADAIDAAQRDGPHGARAAVGVGGD